MRWKTNENERTNSLHKIMIFQIKSVVACVLFLWWTAGPNWWWIKIYAKFFYFLLVRTFVYIFLSFFLFFRVAIFVAGPLHHRNNVKIRLRNGINWMRFEQHHHYHTHTAKRSGHSTGGTSWASFPLSQGLLRTLVLPRSSYSYRV